MSQPKRYRPVSVSKDRVEMHQCVSGEWTSLTEYYTLHDRIAALAAENERLRKAGDAMYHTAQQDGTGLWLHKSFQDWRDAK